MKMVKNLCRLILDENTPLGETATMPFDGTRENGLGTPHEEEKDTSIEEEPKHEEDVNKTDDA